jgi:hypothetical protein
VAGGAGEVWAPGACCPNLGCPLTAPETSFLVPWSWEPSALIPNPECGHMSPWEALYPKGQE